MHMRDDWENKTGVAAPLNSRREFLRMAAATGGAGLLSPVSLGQNERSPVTAEYRGREALRVCADFRELHRRCNTQRS